MRRGSALVEFALAWPLALLVVFGCVQLAIWGAEEHAARSAALAGARAGSAADGSATSATAVAVTVLAPSLVGARTGGWCPGDEAGAPEVWVCAQKGAGLVEVRVGGSVPALVPLIASGGLPLNARVALAVESFSP